MSFDNNLPPGCRITDIPGCRPEDEYEQGWWEGLEKLVEQARDRGLSLEEIMQRISEAI